MQDFIQLAEFMADEAGTIIRHYFRGKLDIQTKPDDTPVTVADRAVEERLREIVQMHRPEDGILGEEFGSTETKNGYTWVFDPIDGTKSFMIGRPTFGTLIALCENGVPVLGVIDQPISNERWIGAKGEPTLFNGKTVKTRSCAGLDQAVVSSTSPSQLTHPSPTPPSPLQRGEGGVGGETQMLWQSMYDNFKSVIWGGDCYAYGLIANGWHDCVIESGLGTYDFCALPPIIEGAGGLICDWNGEPLTIMSKGEIFAVGDPSLKDAVKAFIRSEELHQRSA